MEAVQLSFLVVLASLLLAIDQALGCMCKNEHPQELVCRADFVVRGEIIKKQSVPTGNEFSPNEIMYTVKVKRIFKGEEFMPEEGKLVQIFTPESDAICGEPNLEKGTRYLLSAVYDDYSEQLRTRTCLWNVEWLHITQAQRQGLKHFYNKYCQKCEISEGMSMRPAPGNTLPEGFPMHLMMNPGLGNALPPPKSSTCLYDVAGGKCERFHSSCIRKSTGACGWTTNSNYRRCKEIESLRS